jgi:hypothetical protein
VSLEVVGVKGGAERAWRERGTKRVGGKEGGREREGQSERV